MLMEQMLEMLTNQKWKNGLTEGVFHGNEPQVENRVNILDAIEKLGNPFTKGLLLVCPECGGDLHLGKVMVEQTFGTISIGRDGVADVMNTGCCASHPRPAVGQGPAVYLNLVGKCGHDYQLDFAFQEGRTCFWLCRSNKRADADPVPETLA
jgi:hypothetical protein